MTEAEAAKAPEGMQMKDLNQMPGYKFAIEVLLLILMCLESGHCDSLYLIRTYVYTRTILYSRMRKQRLRTCNLASG